MTVKIKVLGNGFQLVQATPGSSALDIKSTIDFTLTKGKTVKVPLGISTAIPAGMIGYLAVRSGHGARGMQLCNIIGHIDTDYRGEWSATLTLAEWSAVGSMPHKRGDRIMQVTFVKTDNSLMYVEELDETVRGAGGYGHTDRTEAIYSIGRLLNLTLEQRGRLLEMLIVHDVHSTHELTSILNSGTPLRDLALADTERLELTTALKTCTGTDWVYDSAEGWSYKG